MRRSGTASTRDGASRPRISPGSCSAPRDVLAGPAWRSAAASLVAPDSRRRGRPAHAVCDRPVAAGAGRRRYLAASAVRRTPLRFGGRYAANAVPRSPSRSWRSPRWTGRWRRGAVRAVAAQRAPPLPAVSRGFLVAILVGMVSHVPGGIGVFEGLMVLLLRPWSAGGATAAGLCRLSRRLLPAATRPRAARPRLRRSAPAARARRRAPPAARRITERTHPCGPRGRSPSSPACCCCSRAPRQRRPAAWPAAPDPSARRDRDLAFPGQRRRRGAAGDLARPGPPARCGVLPLHDPDLVGMVSLAAQGRRLSRRRRCCSLVLACCGARGRRSIAGRRSSRRASPAPGWRRWSGALGASVWLGLFAFKHVEYRIELWWQFELQGTPRASCVRSVGAAIVAAAGRPRATDRVRRRTKRRADRATDLDDAHRVIAAQAAT